MSDSQYPHSVSILWGQAPEVGDTAKTYSFATPAELDAFLLGVAEMDGWLGYREVNPDYVVGEEGFCESCSEAVETRLLPCDECGAQDGENNDG